MPKDKLMPGECIMGNDGHPLCNEDGKVVKKEVEDRTEAEELIEEGIDENTSNSFGDKIAAIWNKTP